uniref:ORF135 n=1 Tax=Cydia pomonella granulosis virus TaxID=28289 RepID=A0A097P1N1_GVCP|nr:ORF135 [Cydia pomonella granulovirus]AIU37060.1 ORF135 [Cydia pomonella granulovirus]AIU37202.1 ORF135 [Cydia pomonella granulovirus]QGY99430.1 ORF135 [Cydia pomonella granulovirus]QGY99573.1 ORF135 [Cydia pomonella granulovirus]
MNAPGMDFDTENNVFSSLAVDEHARDEAYDVMKKRKRVSSVSLGAECEDGCPKPRRNSIKKMRDKIVDIMSRRGSKGSNGNNGSNTNGVNNNDTFTSGSEADTSTTQTINTSLINSTYNTQLLPPHRPSEPTRSQDDQIKHINPFNNRVWTLRTNNPNQIFVALINIPNAENVTFIQRYLNDTLLRLGGQYNAYQLAHMPGDRAIGYYLFARALIFYGFETKVELLKSMLSVAESMYTNWLKYVPSLYKLVVNLNGNDPTKEIINIVNYHVFLLFKFVMENVLHYSFDGQTMADIVYVVGDEVIDDAYTVNDPYNINRVNSTLTNKYNVQIAQLRRTERIYDNAAATQDININKLKLLRAPAPTIPEPVFVIENRF